MGCRILFEQADADSAADVAAGWRGDRYLVFEGGSALVWKTVWRSPQAATAAAQEYREVCARRFGNSRVTTGTAGAQTDYWMNDSGGPDHYLLTLSGGANDVVFILATTQKSLDLLREKFAGASHG